MKVIDLLNKIAKGEDIPNKIKFDGDIFVYNQTLKDYEYLDKCGWLMDISRDSGNNFLNDEVEIIEEEKDTEELDLFKLQCTIANHYSKENIQCLANEMVRKMNKLRDAVNKLKNSDK